MLWCKAFAQFFHSSICSITFTYRVLEFKGNSHAYNSKCITINKLWNNTEYCVNNSIEPFFLQWRCICWCIDQFSQNYDTCSKTITWWGGLQHKARYFKWLTGWNNCNYLASLYKLLTIDTAHSVDPRHSNEKVLPNEALQMMYVKIRYT